MVRVPTLVCLGLVLLARPARSQKAKTAPPEFTKQGLLITNFDVLRGDQRNGPRAADALRSRVYHATNHRELDVIDGDDIDRQLVRSGYRTDSTIDPSMIRGLGRVLRADEFVLGTVDADKKEVRLHAELVLMRDGRLRQPLPDVRAPKLDSAASMLAREVVAARAQLVHERRCENALRDRHAAEAMMHAQAGVDAYSQSTIARVCLMWALDANHGSHEDVLRVARQVLAIDGGSYHAIEFSALMLDSLHRVDEAGAAWLQLAATDTENIELAERVIFSLSVDGNTRLAQPLATRLAARFPEEIQLVREEWLAAYENHDWPAAVAAGETLMQRDTMALRDGTFYRRLATAYHEAGNVYRALEFIARGVAGFPDDPRMYALYAQYVRAESDTVLPRGLALFPKSPELIALVAQDLKRRGRAEESLVMTKRLLEVDSSVSQGYLAIAQQEFELGRPDSALVSLHKALARGEDSGTVAQFALSKGNGLYQAANGTKISKDFLLALHYVSFADSVHRTSSSQLLVGAASLGAAQTTLTEATKLADKGDRCSMMQSAGELVPVARRGLTAGQVLMPDATKESLDFLDKLEPYLTEQTKASCAP